jgi:hypothetical protein
MIVDILIVVGDLVAEGLAKLLVKVKRWWSQDRDEA